MPAQDIPEHVLIVGAGEFGLSTALALLERPAYRQSRITILESSHALPNPSGSSVDASRIIRTDYACKPYAALASEAQRLWRDKSDGGWGGQGRYSESGFILTANDGCGQYVHDALQNVRELAAVDSSLDINKIQHLDGTDAIQRAAGYEGVSGDSGYANWNSGWAHASKVVEFALQKLLNRGDRRVRVRTGAKVKMLAINDTSQRCEGVTLQDGEHINADLTILAAGAWTPSLVDLEGRCMATGQPIGYIDISAEEQTKFENRPVIMNLSDGLFIIPPTANELKVARHTYGYQNPQSVSFHDGVEKIVSVPTPAASIPEEESRMLRTALQTIVPSVGDRSFSHTRLCWYCDTPSGDFLIDFHPRHPGLFLATGGSGHGFKFFPVLGDKIADRVEGRLHPDLAHIWRWRDATANFISCDDGSRSGKKGLTL